MKRRKFLHLSAFAGIGLSIPFLQGCNDNQKWLTIAAPDFLMHILDKKAMIQAGEDYIRKFPEKTTRRGLEEALAGDIPALFSSPPGEVHEYFNKKTVADFSMGNVETVDGWIISRTEARQCALFSMIQS